jgi:hypothetical protein
MTIGHQNCPGMPALSGDLDPQGRRRRNAFNNPGSNPSTIEQWTLFDMELAEPGIISFWFSH